jgi:D-xylose transport system substrate-binding protein
MRKVFAKKRWGTVLVAVGLCLSMTLAGCGKTAEAVGNADAVRDDDEIVIGMSFDSFVIERWLRDRNVFISAAEDLGAKVNVQSANGDLQEQINQIRYLIKERVDVIVVIPVDCAAIAPVIEEAKDAGIKVISYDRAIVDGNEDLYISFDNEEVGRLMASELKSALPDGGKVFMIGGPLTDENVKQVEKGIGKELKDANLEIVYTYRCDNWNAAEGYDAVKTALIDYPDVSAVICGNDDIATQVFRVLSEERLAGKVLITGQDGDLMACQRIVQGTQLMTVFKSVEQEATVAAQYAVKLANGTADLSSLPTINNGNYDVPYLELKPISVTKENMESVIIAGGFHSEEEVYFQKEEETEVD